MKNSKLIKVWVDGHQYRIFDAGECNTVALLRSALATKLDVDPQSCDLLLETGSAEKTKRLEESESVERIMKRKGEYRIVWHARKGDTGISGPTAVKHEGHISVGAHGIEYRNLPPHWMAIFQALDDKLRTMGEGAMTQVEVQYLIKECASVLLSLPSASTPSSPYPPLSPSPTPIHHAPSSGSPKRRFSRSKLVDTPLYSMPPHDAREAAVQQLEIEMVKLKADKILLEEEVSLLKAQAQSPATSVSTQNPVSDLKHQISLLQKQLLSEQQTTHALREANAKLQAQVEQLTSSQSSQVTNSSPVPSAPPPPPPLPRTPPPSSAKVDGIVKEQKVEELQEKSSVDNRCQLMQAIKEGKRLRASSAPVSVPVKHAMPDSNSIVNILAKVLLDRRKFVQDEKQSDDDEEWDK